MTKLHWSDSDVRAAHERIQTQSHIGPPFDTHIANLDKLCLDWLTMYSRLLDAREIVENLAENHIAHRYDDMLGDISELHELVVDLVGDDDDDDADFVDG